MGIIYRLLPVTNFTQIFNNSAQAKVIDALLTLRSDQTITTTELVNITQLSRRAVMENLSRLEDIGLVTKEGNGKSTFYWGLDQRSLIGKRFISIRDIISNVRIRETIPSQHPKTNPGRQTTKTKRSKKATE